jgi:hypothetical protein
MHVVSCEIAECHIAKLEALSVKHFGHNGCYAKQFSAQVLSLQGKLCSRLTGSPTEISVPTIRSYDIASQKIINDGPLGGRGEGKKLVLKGILKKV